MIVSNKMTRFARSKGSKASNEREPERASSWTEMKEQLLNKNKEILENNKRKAVLDEKNKNYKIFLENELNERNKPGWFDFSKCSNSVQEVKEKRKQNSGVLMKDEASNDCDAPPKEEGRQKQVLSIPSHKLKKTKRKKTKESSSNKNSETEGKNIAEVQVNVKKRLKEKPNDLKNSKIHNDSLGQSKTTVNINLTEKDIKKMEKKKQKRLKQLLKKKATLQKKREEKVESESESNLSEVNRSLTSKDPFLNLKKSKERHPRKKPFLPIEMFINGKTIDISYIDGFPVKKEDAERLKKLRKEMISKGLPRSEINIALKLERRKAEKSFAREKKKVCFNCRQSGHNLSQCPNLHTNNVVPTVTSGFCFKCGSTEHTHFECKVVRGLNYKFATCFICNELGHIASQCPGNERGLYPKGGACNVCGDVTHLKKDCPKHHTQQQDQAADIRVKTIKNSNPDVIEEVYNNSAILYNKQLNKVIKF